MSADPHRALMKALAAHLGPIDGLTARTRDWASIMFTGMRHHIGFVVPWTAECERRVDGLADAELPMRDHFVADIRVLEKRRDGDGLYLTIEALTIAEA